MDGVAEAGKYGGRGPKNYGGGVRKTPDSGWSGAVHQVRR
jgi:hypothetical protein